ncbi:hypothetical protein DYI23_18600 [Roseibium polysiphoniae]|uniref:Uncharacterized protein n=1 Tax=Roseibium polysiphoniae TaxID=2571221 RepID=A0A944CFL4_9HYPH|nr:hypothetical protein [Roseibium polysiphoniae]
MPLPSLEGATTSTGVILGLVPRIHSVSLRGQAIWIAGTSPTMTTESVSSAAWARPRHILIRHPRLVRGAIFKPHLSKGLAPKQMQ